MEEAGWPVTWSCHDLSERVTKVEETIKMDDHGISKFRTSNFTNTDLHRYGRSIVHGKRRAAMREMHLGSMILKRIKIYIYCVSMIPLSLGIRIRIGIYSSCTKYVWTLCAP